MNIVMNERHINEVASNLNMRHRQQLECLLVEGSIDQKTLDGIHKAHPITIPKTCDPVTAPKRNPDFQSQRISYVEAVEGLIARIAKSFSPWDETLGKLDPIKQGWFSEADPDKLASDLIVTTALIRCQALPTYFEAECNEIEARVFATINDKLSVNAAEFYHTLKAKWLLLIAEYSSPLTGLAQEIQNRNCPSIGENPMVEISIADLVVSTSWYFWASMKLVAQLHPE